MDISPNILNKSTDLIKFFEQCRLISYQDTGGIWTIGWGATKNVIEGMQIDQQTADNWLNLDIAIAYERAKHFVKVVLNEDQWSAVVSQAYNLKSFQVLVEHLNQDIKEYKEKMLLYCHDAQGNLLKGLKIRRIAERLLFESRSWHDEAVAMQELSISRIVQKEKELFV
jgi:lysozyme